MDPSTLTGQLSAEERTQLVQTASMFEKIVETQPNDYQTLEVLEDRKTMESLTQAEEDVRAGRVRDYGGFIGELRRSGEV